MRVLKYWVIEVSSLRRPYKADSIAKGYDVFSELEYEFLTATHNSFAVAYKRKFSPISLFTEFINHDLIILSDF